GPRSGFPNAKLPPAAPCAAGRWSLWRSRRRRSFRSGDRRSGDGAGGDELADDTPATPSGMGARLEDPTCELGFGTPLEAEHLRHRAVAYDKEVDHFRTCAGAHLALVAAVARAEIDDLHTLRGGPFQLAVRHDRADACEREPVVVAAGDTVLF